MMSPWKYLIVGSSHAGLSALEAIRRWDEEGSIAILSEQNTLPYSPTVLPYIMSKQIERNKVFLRNEEAFDLHKATFMRGAKVVAVDEASRSVSLDSGKTLEFEKLLLATGATPTLPPIKGIEDTPHHILRTLDHATGLRDEMKAGNSAIVLGAGLIGLHAAENLSQAGIKVTVIETMPQVLPSNFDLKASGLIQQAFKDEGITVLTGSTVKELNKSNGTCTVSLESGDSLSANLILVSTGVRPRIEYLEGSQIVLDQGILVDDTMRTNVDGIWAAGDVAQARDFFDDEKQINATLPNAVEQGRIAGMDMAEDPALKPYPGGIAMNSFRFFGQRAFSVGLSAIGEPAEDFEIEEGFSPENRQYQKFVFKNKNLVGVTGINCDLDPGVMFQLIKKKIDLEDVMEQFTAAPTNIGRILMTKLWR